MAERALILVRQSLTKKDSVSLEAQEAAADAYCARQSDPYRVVDVIREPSVRGWRNDREAMADIYRRAERRQFDVLVTWDLSRVARSVRNLENLVYELGKRHARFESVTEPWVSNPLVRQVIAAAAEEQTRTISRNVASAVRIRGAQGVWHGATPFGYRRGDDHKLIVCDTEAAIVRLIFARYADGARIAEIQRALNADPSVPPRARGGRWTTGAIWKALRKDVYRGDIVIDSAMAGNARFDGITVEGAHPAIIDPALWDRVQRRIAEVRPALHDMKAENHWLEGHVYCGCGAPMYYVVRRSVTSRIWMCRHQTLFVAGTRPEPCPQPSSYAGAGWVERGTLGLLREALKRGSAAPDERLRKLVDKPDRRAEKAGTDLDALRRQRDNLIALVKHGAPPETVAPELAVLAGQIAAKEREVAAFAPTRTLDDLRVARAFASDLAGMMAVVEPDVLRAGVERLGLRVVVDPAEWRVTLSFGPGFALLGEPTKAGKPGTKGSKRDL